MGLAPFNRGMGQTYTTDVIGVSADAAFHAHIQVTAAAAIAPAAASTLAATALTAAAQAITAAISSPAWPRSISITGNASGITGGVTVKGTNYAGAAITETIALNGTATVEGNKAFEKVTEIDLPVQTHSGTDTVSIGIGSKLGLPYLLAHNTVIASYLDNAKESTAPTVTTDAANIDGNTISLATALSGKVVDIYLLV